MIVRSEIMHIKYLAYRRYSTGNYHNCDRHIQTSQTVCEEQMQ